MPSGAPHKGTSAAMPASLLQRLTFRLFLLLLAGSANAAHAAGDSIGDFEITRFEVTGNTLLDPADVQSLVSGLAGKNRNFGDVEQAIAALEGAYRERGFSLVKVVLPEQELNQGVVHITVIETRIGRVRVADNEFHDAANIRRSLPTIVEGTVPNTDALSANLRMANENPSKKASLQLQSGALPGVVDAVVQVVDAKSWSAGAVLDNSGNDSSGRTHVTAQYQNFDIGGLDHVFTAQYTTSPENPGKLSVYGAGYHIPLYSLRGSLDFYGSYSSVDAGVVSAGPLDLTVSGAGTVFGTHFNHELRRIGSYESRLTLGFDHKAFRNDVELLGTQLGSDITVNPLSLSYVAEWALPAGNLNFYLTGVRNIPGGSQASDANFTAARSGATSNYALLRYGIGFARPLFRDWQARVTLNGQATNDALVSGEQFGAGGATSVRGLQEREISNDQGFIANLELHTPNLCGEILSATTRCNALAFLDGARLSRNGALAGETARERVSSAGAGFRLSSGRSLSLQVDFGRVVSASEAQVSGEQRLHASLVFAY
jgi:hemolysin activation/secretion protein